MAKVTPRTQIVNGAKELEKFMTAALREMSKGLIDQVIKSSAKDLTPKGLDKYKDLMTDMIGDLAQDSIDQVRKEVPAAKNVKLSELNSLPADLKKKLKLNIDLLSQTQIDDLIKALSFSYLHSYDSTDSLDIIRQDLIDGAEEWIGGNAIRAGANVTAATVVTAARDAFFDEPAVSENIEAFVFRNGDPVTPICTQLDGTVFDKDDPDRFRFTPPLHWNCKSWIEPVVMGKLGNREIEKLETKTTKKGLESIQFGEALAFALSEASKTGL